MKKPEPGYYRKMLPSNMVSVRIALTAQPMTGVTRRPDLSEPLAAYFENQEDPFGCFYAKGLRSGAMIPVVPLGAQKMWSPGELFLKS